MGGDRVGGHQGERENEERILESQEKSDKESKGTGLDGRMGGWEDGKGERCEGRRELRKIRRSS